MKPMKGLETVSKYIEETTSALFSSIYPEDEASSIYSEDEAKAPELAKDEVPENKDKIKRIVQKWLEFRKHRSDLCEFLNIVTLKRLILPANSTLLINSLVCICAPEKEKELFNLAVDTLSPYENVGELWMDPSRVL